MVEARRIVDKAFAKRLEKACDEHPHAPPGHGRQKWVRDQIWEKFGVKLSPEAVRKWFAGEARPRPKTMRQLAQALEVDEAWLSLGMMPGMTEREKRQQNAIAAGAVNLVAGLIQMQGGHIAFPTNPNEGADIYVIIKGRQHQIEVKAAVTEGSRARFTLPVGAEERVVIGVIPQSEPGRFHFLRLTPEIIETGKKRGGYREVSVEMNGSAFLADGEPVPQIHSFDNLDGEVVRPKPVPLVSRRKLRVS